MTRVLVLSPHPDDEAIGCGGTLRAHAVAGAAVHAVFLTSGERGGHGRSPEETAALREDEARAAARVLGLAGAEFWREPDGALRASAGCVARLRARIRELRPSVMYVTHDREMHPDHRAAARLAARALRGITPRKLRPETFMYEVWTPLQRLEHIVDITAHADVKRAAIRAHRSQCDVMSFDEAALGLNRYRGELHCWPEGEYAEVFARLAP